MNYTLDQAIQICRILGLDPDTTKAIVLTPEAMFVTCYRLNAQGRKFVDGITGEIAMDYDMVPIGSGETP